MTATSETAVVTRFAPSPTGFLHIGGARTALFNWLFARHHGGKFLLRIEDTDKARSTPEATEAIFRGLRWLGLDWDGEAVSQAARADRHAEIARAMLADGTAYRCYATQDEIAAYREAARAEGRSTLFRSPWRDRTDWPNGPYTIRLKAPQDTPVVIEDAVQGRIAWAPDQMDDLILLRSDGTPVYMLAVVVDDHDSGVTHVIRGDDHLTNAARQTLIYRAMGWTPPVFAHLPLIHGADGAKLSKRHGALGVEEYAAMGYPAEAMRNHLARLGWSHGDDEVFSTEQAIAWFDLGGVGKAPARFDFARLDNLSGQHIRAMDDVTLTGLVVDFAAAHKATSIPPARRDLLLQAMPGLKDRAKTLADLLDSAHYILSDRPFIPDEKAARLLDTDSRAMLARLTPHLQNASDFTATATQDILRSFAEAEGLKLGKVAQPVRAALTGRTVSPSVFDIFETLGRDEALARLHDAVQDTA